MNIQNITPTPTKNYYQQNRLKNNNSAQHPQQTIKYDDIKYSQIAFGAIYNVHPKKINIELEKSKLLKQITELLNTEAPECNFEDMLISSVRTVLNQYRASLKKQQTLLMELENLANVRNEMNPAQKVSKLNQLKKEFKQAKSLKSPAPKKNIDKKQNEQLDYQLLNKFKSAVLEGNFNLQEIFKEHFGILNKLTSIEEVNKIFPKIKIPQNPAEVIAKKIESVLTRDFYEQIDEFYETNNNDKLVKLTAETIKNYVNQIGKKFNIDPESLTKKIADPLQELIAQRYAGAKVEKGFSSIPEQRKIKTPQITENDIKLLSVDFDDFVLSVLKKQYLESKKLNEIVYDNGKTSIALSSLREPEYKFDKISEKIKKIINMSDTIHRAQRDYDNFNTQQLKDRLGFYANSILGNNEEILEHIINFDSSHFGPEDTKNAIRFLRELDSVEDGEKTVQEALTTITKEGIKPKDTERLNELEKQKATARFKLEQQKAFELKNLTGRFDESINMLYSNNLNNIANTCSKYRPESLDPKTIDDAEFIIKTIQNNINEDSINTAKLEANIMRWDTYKFYKNNEQTSPIFKNAVKFAQEQDGSINIDKAGKYIINAELVENYPQSLEIVRNPEVFTKIMDRTGANTEAAIKYLCKFDDYQDLDTVEKTYISELMNIFDTKDNIDKTLLRHIVENDYIKSDTSVLTNIHENGSKAIKVTIGTKAKQEIINKYKYPICLEYLKGFEDALSTFAGATGESGIKQMGRNNKALEYKIELKLKGHDDRLFSSKNDYYFDIFSDRGLH